MKNGERVETLTELGFTLNQARAYLALVQFGPGGAKKLSDNSKISRQDIYRVMLSLEQSGIVEKLISKPTAYRAMPINQATHILLERKIGEQKELQKKTRELVHSLESDCTKKENTEVATQFIMIPGKEAIMQKLGKTLQKTQRSLEVVTSHERFSHAILEFKDKYADALQRGVKIKIVAQQTAMEKQVLKILHDLREKGEFEVRWFANSPEAIVSIFDETEAAVTISAIANTAKASALWSNDASFIALTQNYFKNKWNESAEFDSLAVVEV